MSVIWEDPPAHGGIRDAVAAKVDEFKANPGRWGIWAENVASSTTATPKRHGLQVRTSGTSKGRCTVYARYIPAVTA